MIIRDDQGHLMVARTTWREQCMQVYEGEAWSLLYQIPPIDISEGGNLVNECKELMSQTSSFELGFVKRQANGIAYQSGFKQMNESHPCINITILGKQEKRSNDIYSKPNIR
ncbi:hypothetical protein JHK82_024988 [Glycine max]|uniref:Uncharacterized protein n=1 Tax=Glycine max TaxID=3847 RepID=A0A0R0IF35_SOYBN|nr:hypothetical protein JHK87_024931 [Glycine soja]KAG5007061.1 hypothetical protein JHK85_025603 [Glycine max]KAG5133800.1 hypothetical protein JHK82_024988 [Glycine max]KAH1042830.1 hypothetical protein GYH30_024923 [Glycine max]